jgi:hypothetical protein
LYIPYNEIKVIVKNEKVWEDLIIKNLQCLFRKFCLSRKSETIYDNSNITQRGMTVKENTILQLKKQRIFIEYSPNRSRKITFLDDALDLDLLSLYDH